MTAIYESSQKPLPLDHSLLLPSQLRVNEQQQQGLQGSQETAASNPQCVPETLDLLES